MRNHQDEARGHQQRDGSRADFQVPQVPLLGDDIRHRIEADLRRGRKRGIRVEHLEEKPVRDPVDHDRLGSGLGLLVLDRCGHAGADLLEHGRRQRVAVNLTPKPDAAEQVFLAEAIHRVFAKISHWKPKHQGPEEFSRAIRQNRRHDNLMERLLSARAGEGGVANFLLAQRPDQLLVHFQEGAQFLGAFGAAPFPDETGAGIPRLQNHARSVDHPDDGLPRPDRRRDRRPPARRILLPFPQNLARDLRAARPPGRTLLNQESRGRIAENLRHLVELAQSRDNRGIRLLRLARLQRLPHRLGLRNHLAASRRLIKLPQPSLRKELELGFELLLEQVLVGRLHPVLREQDGGGRHSRNDERHGENQPGAKTEAGHGGCLKSLESGNGLHPRAPSGGSSARPPDVSTTPTVQGFSRSGREPV